jgi:predicted AlkP superfamily phosphohydrolase/phosphomutase
MRFLRMFTNSLLAGVLSAAYLTVLVLQLNPHVPLVSATTWRWFLTLGASYGLHLAIAFYVLIVMREFFSMTALSPGWASVRVLAWLSAIAAAVAALLMWLNVNAFAAVLGEVAARRMSVGAIATSASALVLFVVAIVHYSYGRRGSRVGGALFTLAALGSLALPLAARGPASVPVSALRWGPASAALEAPTGASVVMVMLDGASLEYIRTRAAEGRLVNFSKLLDGGASMYLATVRPTQPGPVWAAVATGMYPAKNGVRSAAEYVAWGDDRAIHLLPDHCFSHALVRLGAVRSEPNTSAAWRARPLWSILTNAGMTSGVVRWPFTYPAPPIRGFVLSERFLTAPGSMAQFDERAAHPPEALATARTSFGEAEGGELGSGDDDGPEAASARRDRAFVRAARDLRSARPVQFLALRLQALDTAGHRRYHDRQSSAFRDGSETERRIRAQHLERAYTEVDAEIGRVVDGLAPQDLLLVVSGFGMQRLNPIKELLARAVGDPITRGSHERAPDGFMMAYGAPVQRGRLPRGSIVDVTPTILYFFGLPIGRDMDGFARTDLFKAEFTAERPIAFIATHNR